jgi:hypothetical protein
MGTRCCENGCAACCSDDQCSDNIACTVDKCTESGCTHEPDNSLCSSAGTHCDAQQGCIGCKTNEECDDHIACTTDTCNLNNNTCLHASSCMAGYCEPTTGACVECKQDSDCQGGLITTLAAPPIGTKCSVTKCKENKCVPVTLQCAGEQRCCPPLGCSILCVIDTTQ